MNLGLQSLLLLYIQHFSALNCSLTCIGQDKLTVWIEGTVSD